MIFWCVTSRKKNATWAQQTTNEHDFFPRAASPLQKSFFVRFVRFAFSSTKKKTGKKSVAEI